MWYVDFGYYCSHGNSNQHSFQCSFISTHNCALVDPSSLRPTILPSFNPTIVPTTSPSFLPSSNKPTINPSSTRCSTPSASPTLTFCPTMGPTLMPSAPFTSSGYQSNSPWSHYRGLYNTNTGQSPYLGVKSPQIKRKYDAGIAHHRI